LADWGKDGDDLRFDDESVETQEGGAEKKAHFEGIWTPVR
jgi:hypothetical protein